MSARDTKVRYFLDLYSHKEKDRYLESVEVSHEVFDKVPGDSVLEEDVKRLPDMFGGHTKPPEGVKVNLLRKRLYID